MTELPLERMYPDSDTPDPPTPANFEGLGSHLKTLVDGQIIAFRFWHTPCTGIAHHITLWDFVTKERIWKASNADALDVPSHDGWFEVTLTTPVDVVAGHEYVISYGAGTTKIGGAPRASVAPSLTLISGCFGSPFECPPDIGLDATFADVVFQPFTALVPESKGLTKAREQLLDALKASGIDAYYGMGQFNPPCARVFPAEPWVEVGGLASGRRIQRWEVWAVAGRTDSIATFDEVEAMVMAIDSAIEGLPEWGTPLWRRPAVTDMGGTKYFACRGIIETRAEVH